MTAPWAYLVSLALFGGHICEGGRGGGVIHGGFLSMFHGPLWLHKLLLGGVSTEERICGGTITDFYGLPIWNFKN